MERVKSLYYGEISFNDHSLGALIQHLRDEEIYDDTVVVFTSDHGEEFKDHGGSMHGQTLFEEAIHVPLILRYPRALPVAHRVRAPVELVDIAATLLDLAEIDAPHALNGVSLRPEARRGEPFVYSTLDLDENHLKSFTTPPWKLIRNEASGATSLFNLELDPGETWNLARQHPEKVTELEARLDAQMAQNAAQRRRLLGDGIEAAVSESELPQEAADALRELGYIDMPEIEGPEDAAGK